MYQWILEFTYGIRLRKVSEYYNETRGIISSGILDCGRTVDFINNYKIGSIVDMNTEKNNISTTSLICDEYENMDNGIRTISGSESNLSMIKLFIENEIHNTNIIIPIEQIWQTFMNVGRDKQTPTVGSGYCLHKQQSSSWC